MPMEITGLNLLGKIILGAGLAGTLYLSWQSVQSDQGVSLEGKVNKLATGAILAMLIVSLFYFAGGPLFYEKKKVGGETNGTVKPANLVVSSLGISPEEVEPGKTVSISVLVKNEGDMKGSRDVALYVDGEKEMVENVTMEGGEKSIVSFTLNRDNSRAFSVRVENLRGSFRVLEPAKFEVSNLKVNPEKVEIGEKVDISVDVKNVGEVQGTHGLEFQVGDWYKTENVSLKGGAENTISLLIQGAKKGKHEIRVENLSDTYEVVDSEISRKKIFRIAAGRPSPGNVSNPFGSSYLDLDGGHWFAYETLGYRETLSGEIKPLLAENWGFTGDKTFVINIRSEAHFRNGTPVTADDVVFSLKKLGMPKYGGTPISVVDNLADEKGGEYGNVMNIEKVDGKTVKVHLKDGYSRDRRVMGLLYGEDHKIVPKDRWSSLLEKPGGNIGDMNPNLYRPSRMNASGPYTLFGLMENRAIFKRVENYWGEELGIHYLPEYVEIKYYGTWPAYAARDNIREMDISFSAPGRSSEFYENKKDYMLTWNLERKNGRSMFFQNPDSIVIAPNYEKEIFRHRWVRKALQYAMDQENAVNMAWDDRGLPTPPTYLATDASYYDRLVNTKVIKNNYETRVINAVSGDRLGIAHTPKRAIGILENHCEGSVEEGWWYPNRENGEKLGPWKIDVVKGWKDVENICETAARNWSEIGIEVERNSVTYSDWKAVYKSGTFDFIQKWAYSFMDGAAPLGRTFRSNFVLSPEDIRPSSVWSSGIRYQKYWSESLGLTENTADEVKKLTKELFSLERNSEEYVQTVKELQEIIVPQQTVILGGSQPYPKFSIRDRWINWPNIDDPYETKWGYCPTLGLKYCYPKGVEITDFSLSEKSVSPDGAVKASVSVRNSDDVGHNYVVKIREGKPEPGIGPEVVGSSSGVVPANGTRTFEIELSFEESGKYDLIVDEWRIDKWDPGSPLDRTLEVTERH